MKPKIISIDEYHDVAQVRYYKAMDDFKKGVVKLCPVRNQFYFLNSYGEVRRDGFVLLTDSSAHWYKRKGHAINKMRTYVNGDTLNRPDA
jgi:hypothetical protein